jgi:hypothetical protein
MIKMAFYSLFMVKEMKKEFYFGKSSPLPPGRPTGPMMRYRPDLPRGNR